MDTSINPLVEPRTWWVIKNDRGIACTRPGGCGKVHEYWTHGCRPVAFDKPWEWEIFERRQVVDETGKGQDFISSRFGRPEQITEREAQELNVFKNPPPSGLVAARSYPSHPTRRFTNGGRSV